MGIIEVLKNEHNEFKGQFKKALSHPQKDQEFERLRKELMIHMQGEEEFFYPKTIHEIKNQTLESIEEHHIAKVTLSELEIMSGKEDSWQAKLKVLKEEVEHHLEEEESNLFPKAMKKLTKSVQNEMAQSYEQLKEKTGTVALFS